MKSVAQTVIEADRFYTIAAHTGNVIQAVEASKDGGTVRLGKYDHKPEQEWSFVRVGEGVYRIRNRASGKLLDLTMTGTANGTILALTPVMFPAGVFLGADPAFLAVAILSGTICDGAKPSCAAKIAAAVDAGIMGYRMYLHHREFRHGEGIVGSNVDDTIAKVGVLAQQGMRQTDRTILDIMQDRCS